VKNVRQLGAAKKSLAPARTATAATRATSRRSYRKAVALHGGLTERRRQQNKDSLAAFKKKHGHKGAREKAAAHRRNRRFACAGLAGKQYNLRELGAATGKHTEKLYRCEDEDGEPFVIKVIKVEGTSKKDATERCVQTSVKAQDEVALLRVAGHTGAKCGSAANIVIPLAEHSLLDWACSDGVPVPPVRAVDAARGVCTALNELHARNCSHGDLGGSATGDHLRFVPTVGIGGHRDYRVVLIDFDKGKLRSTVSERARDRRQAAAGLLSILKAKVRPGGILDKEIGRRLRNLNAESCTLESIVSALSSK
jgi:hypothetical protein